MTIPPLVYEVKGEEPCLLAKESFFQLIRQLEEGTFQEGNELSISNRSFECIVQSFLQKSNVEMTMKEESLNDYRFPVVWVLVNRWIIDDENENRP